MKKLSKDTKFAHLGKPGTIFSKGFQRRLSIITSIVDFNNKKILDVGCGEGVWLKQFLKYTSSDNIFGTDIDSESIHKAIESTPEIKSFNLRVSKSENMDFADNFFDIVFQNEVLEHVQDDLQTIKECLRILKPGGYLILFTPNSGWPFETHGIFYNGKYYWGNIPLLPWLPKSIQKKYAPHVRNYTNNEIETIIKKASIIEEKNKLTSKIIYHKHVFSAFDGLERKFGIIGKAIKKTVHSLEKTPLHFFGISHLLIIQKT